MARRRGYETIKNPPMPKPRFVRTPQEIAAGKARFAWRLRQWQEHNEGTPTYWGKVIFRRFDVYLAAGFMPEEIGYYGQLGSLLGMGTSSNGVKRLIRKRRNDIQTLMRQGFTRDQAIEMAANRDNARLVDLYGPGFTPMIRLVYLDS